MYKIGQIQYEGEECEMCCTKEGKKGNFVPLNWSFEKNYGYSH